MSVISNKALKQVWWYGLNVLTTLLIVATLGGTSGNDGATGPTGPTGPAGSNGTDGTNGSDGENGLPGLNGGDFEYGSFDYDNLPLSDDDQDEYVEDRLEEGYIALDSAEDFSRFNLSGGLTAAEALENYRLKYVLTSDIDFATEGDSSAFVEFLADEGGDYGYIDFTGVFDGAGYTISNYTETIGENSELSHGFFKSVDRGTIKNVTFDGIAIAAGAFSGYAGIVAGKADDSTFMNVSVRNSIVISDTDAGGLIGATRGDHNFLLNIDISDSLVHGNELKGGLIGFNGINGNDESVLAIVDSRVENVVLDTIETSDLMMFPVWFPFRNSTYAGGFIGNSNATGSIYIYNSFNTSNIFSDDVTGGLIGYLDLIENLYIINSYNSGSIFADDDLGGLVGDVNLRGELVIQNSFNAGDLFNEDDDVGGLIANVYYYDAVDDAKVTLNNVYNSGKLSVVESGNDVGGLIANVDNYIDVTITNAFNVGTFSSNLVAEEIDQGDDRLGGIIGNFNGYIPLFNNVFVYVDNDNALDYIAKVSGNGWSAGARIITDIEDFTEADFRLSKTWNFETVWEFNEESVFPLLQDLDFVKVGLDYDYTPYMGFTYSSFVTDYALGFSYTGLQMEAYDLETPAEALIVKMYLTNQNYEGSLEGFLEIATLLGTFTGDQLVGDFSYTTLEAAQYFLWFYVEDSVGNYSFNYYQSFYTIID